jgi:hypothetical protein
MTETRLDNMIGALSAVTEPGAAEHNPSLMTSIQIEEASLQLIGALDKLHALLEILERCSFRPGDKEKAEQLVALTTERIGWALSVLSCLKPVN